MKVAPHLLPLAALLACAFPVAAQEAAKEAPADPEPAWTFGVTAYHTDVRAGSNYGSGIAVADRGPLHFEARINYESVGARSAFVGWSFSGGDEFKWMFRPLVGGAWGDIKAFVPALEASLGYKQFDFYTEAEYVRLKNDKESRYLYAWTEVGYKPLDWLRLGLVVQRTRAYGGDRDIQSGPFAQATVGQFTFGGFWFNPGSGDQVFVASVGVAF
ncbi:hypothetical protein WG902_00745 [Ramlibacter sp. PS3R-8]|uniref:hypothetical protein n=1 Tax=Ramlibacter sp. PS3R-8 TaxID=3133437 RepID=UPI0030B4DD8A